VRDLLLRKKPKDFDIATDAVPKRVAKLFKKTVPVGAQFGVMLVVLDNLPFEVATFRTDEGYRDGRHPTAVRFASAQEDALRRDFTVNGIFFDPLSRRVMDWVEGEKDLRKKIIRAIGDPKKRFAEDKLRMLRAVRFASVLGFKIEAKTFASVKRFAPQIKAVSQERIRDELIKMFTGPHPGLALKLLDKAGLLKEVLPEVAKMKGVQQPRAFHPEGDVFRHTALLLEQLKNPPPVLAFGCLLHDVGKPATFRRADRIRFNGHDRVGAKMSEHILTRLRFSNDLKDKIVACVDGHMRFKDVPAGRQGEGSVCLAMEPACRQAGVQRLHNSNFDVVQATEAECTLPSAQTDGRIHNVKKKRGGEAPPDPLSGKAQVSLNSFILGDNSARRL